MTQTAAQLSIRSEPHCFGVRIPLVPIYFDWAWELLKPAAARNGLYTKESVLSGLLAGEFQLWVAEAGDKLTMAAITEVADYPARRVGIVVLLGGEELDRCLPFLDTMEAWAKSVGCQRFVGSGRPGLSKKLAARGYKVTSMALAKDLYDA